MEECDSIKLRTCTACKLVRYCGVKCQKDHRSKHKKACKKRAAELHEEILFRQPQGSHFGDCPICLIPLPLDRDRRTMMTCCSKLICDGCNYANSLRMMEQSLGKTCPFCRQCTPHSAEESDLRVMKRAQVNDPVAIREVGLRRYEEGDYTPALEYLTKAAKLGDVVAHFNLSIMFGEGQGVDRDKMKEIHHLELAAIGGHFKARFNLGAKELQNGRIERAVKHWIIAASTGDDYAIDHIRRGCAQGFVSREDYAAALRAHQAAVDETKSPQREAARVAEQNGESMLRYRD
jgi:hypothetical protein